MKNFFVVLALFSAMVLMISCGGGSKSGDTTDTGETVTDEDSADSDPSDSWHENPDTNPEQPDNGDTTPGNDSDIDSGDTTPDNGDTEPDNDYPQTPCDPNPCIGDANSTGICTIKDDSYVCGCIDGYIFDGTLCIKSLPECSPASATPCIDSATGLIWSAKSASKMPWNDAVNYCRNLTEGDFNDWRLPSIAVLKTLVQNCSSAKCTEDYTGKYSKFGDTVYLWSSSENEDSTAQSVYFSDASTQSVSIDTNVNVRCVRRETESRESNCTGLIENSVWNTATQITQTWDWETAGWTPSPQGSYNAEGSGSECRFKCDSSSFWDGSSQCLNPCKPNPCNDIGETGVCVAKSTNEYTCECEDNYFPDDSSNCLNPCNPNPCTGIGETGVCVGKNANEYTCECEYDYVWNPYLNECIENPCYDILTSTGEYILIDGTKYACECEENYVWNSYSNDCMENPCYIPNSTGVCNPISETKYTCECEENYFWDGSSNCLNPCDTNPCEGIVNSTSNSCNPSSWNQYSCGCKSGYYWWGPEKGCMDKRPGLGNICTGQTSCYSEYRITCPASPSGTDDEYNFYGQDAQYTSKCTAQSFTASSDVVVDNNTGLTWEKSPSSSTYTWSNRNTHCSELNSSNYGGRSNWRVPNPLELLSIVDNSRYNPATNSNFTNMPTGTDAYLWTNNEYKGSTSNAYVFVPSYGHFGYDAKTSNYKVLCVSGNEMPKGVFSSQTISGSVVVTDSTTGLMWQKTYATSKTWQQALKYCEDSTYAGYSDWRLPNKNELASLLDHDKSAAPYSDFPDMPSNDFWSSSTILVLAAWSVNFNYAYVTYNPKNLNSYVRCVR